MKTFLLFIFASIIVLPFVFAQKQNLLIDGGFENYAAHWTIIAGSPDFYNDNKIDSTRNHPAVLKTAAYTGNYYIGLAFFFQDYKSEFLLSKFKTPLQANVQYSIRMMVRKASEFCYHPFKEISIGILDTIPDITPKLRSIKGKYLPLFNKTKTLISADSKWEEVSAMYQAKGGEQYLLIGNYMGANYDLVTVAPLDACYFYHYDEVIVEPILPGAVEITVGKSMVFNEIQFKTAGYELEPSSFSTLNNIADFLQKDPTLQLQIAGHTDEDGTENYNLVLSENRAKTVYQYLIGKNIAAERLTYKGYGEGKPLNTTGNAAAKAKNRRVEFTILINK